MSRETEILDMIRNACIEAGAQKVILFGSRAKGTHHERSDFDIAVAGVTDMILLQQMIEELPTLYEIDVVDLDTCKNHLLMEEIKEYGCKIFEAL